MLKLKIDEELFKIDLAPLAGYVNWSPGAQYFTLAPGKEHYALLACLASQLPSGTTVADCGTLYGASALALSHNPEVEVYTFDIVDCLLEDEGRRTVKDRHNVWFEQRSCLDAVAEIAGNALVTVLDIDPHDGQQEAQFFAELLTRSYKGILICDDINLNRAMRGFWSCLGGPVKRVDLTRWGHWSGTGAVVFDADTIDLEIAL